MQRLGMKRCEVNAELQGTIVDQVRRKGETMRDADREEDSI